MLALLAFSSVASAATVKITSFRYVSNTSVRVDAAELCGVVTPAPATTALVKITSDPGLKEPGYYYATAGNDGKFCHVIATFTGRANAGVVE